MILQSLKIYFIFFSFRSAMNHVKKYWNDNKLKIVATDDLSVFRNVSKKTQNVSEKN